MNNGIVIFISVHSNQVKYSCHQPELLPNLIATSWRPSDRHPKAITGLEPWTICCHYMLFAADNSFWPLLGSHKWIYQASYCFATLRNTGEVASMYNVHSWAHNQVDNANINWHSALDQPLTDDGIINILGSGCNYNIDISGGCFSVYIH